MKRIQSHKGVVGTIVVNSEGNCVLITKLSVIMYATQHLFQDVPFHGSCRYKPKQNVVRPIFQQLLEKIYMCGHLSIVVPILSLHILTKRFLAVLNFVHSVEL